MAKRSRRDGDAELRVGAYSQDLNKAVHLNAAPGDPTSNLVDLTAPAGELKLSNVMANALNSNGRSTPPADVRETITEEDTRQHGLELDKIYRLIDLYAKGFERLVEEIIGGSSAVSSAPSLVGKVWSAFVQQAERYFEAQHGYGVLLQCVRDAEAGNALLVEQLKQQEVESERQGALNIVKDTALSDAKNEIAKHQSIAHDAHATADHLRAANEELEQALHSEAQVKETAQREVQQMATVRS